MAKVSIIHGSVVFADTDAIVNAANHGLREGGGVCGAIFQEAGAAKLQKACDAIGHCRTGSAVVTPGFDCMAKYIVHAVGPIYSGRPQDDELLASAYRACLDCAEAFELTSIGLCSISTGIYGFPIDRAARIAIKVLTEYPTKSLKDIRVYCYGGHEFNVFNEALAEAQ